MRGAWLLVACLLLAGCVQESGTVSTSSSATTSGTDDTSASGTATTSANTANPTGDTTPAQWSPEPWRDVPCNLQKNWGPLNTPFPSILGLDGQGNMTRYAWQGKSLIQASNTATGVVFATVVGSEVFSAEKNATGWHLAARTNQLLARASIAISEATAIASFGRTIYVASRWNLTAYDTDLHQLGRAALSAPDARTLPKQVDAIRIADGYAYLLDDVVQPFVVFRVDIRSPTAMRQLFSFDTSSSATPTLQWLNRTSGTWYVESNQFGMGGGTRSMVPLAIADGKAGKSLTIQSVSYPSTPQETAPRREQGYMVFDSTFVLPAWAIIGPGNLSIALVNIRGDTVERSCMTTEPGDNHLLAYQDLLVTWGRSHVRVWEAHDQVRPMVDALLPMLPVALWAMSSDPMMPPIP